MARMTGVDIPNTSRVRLDAHRPPATLPVGPAVEISDDTHVAQMARGVAAHAWQMAQAVYQNAVERDRSHPADARAINRHELVAAANVVVQRVAGFAALDAAALEDVVAAAGALISADHGLSAAARVTNTEARLKGLMLRLRAAASDQTPETLPRGRLEKLARDPQVIDPLTPRSGSSVELVSSVVAAAHLANFAMLTALCTPDHAATLRALAPSPAAQHQLMAWIASATERHTAVFSSGGFVKFGDLTMTLKSSGGETRLAFHQRT